MARYIVRHSYIDIIGGIWWPYGSMCSLRKDLSGYDIENMRDEDGDITRDSVEQWVMCNSGDFSSIVDFRGSIEDGDTTIDLDWKDEDSEWKYIDTLPSED